MPTVTRAMRIGESAAQEYARWRDPAAVARFLVGVEGMTPVTPDTVRWQLHGPAGFAMEMTARLTRDEPEHLMVWKATDAPFAAILAVRFEPISAEETRVTLQLTAEPPGGPLVNRAVEGYLGHAVEDSLKRLAALVQAERDAAP